MAVWAPIRPKTSSGSSSVSTSSPGLGVGLEGARLVERELDERVLDLLDRGPRAEDADLAGVGVDPDVDVLVAGDAAIGGLDAVLHRVDQLLARDLLLGVELEEGTDEIATHGASSLLPNSRWPTKRNVGVTHVTERPFSSRGSIHPERGPSIRTCSGAGSEPRFPGGRRGDSRRRTRGRYAGPRSVSRIAPVDVVLEDVDELVDEALAAERPVEPAVDEDRRDRVLERARQRDPDVGVLATRPGRSRRSP